jgi:hypothetical protein
MCGSPQVEAIVILYSLFFSIAAALISISAFAQIGQIGPSGDFRVEGRPGTAPTVGPPGGPGLPPGPAAFRDSLGGRTPDEILKGIDKELGKGSHDTSDSLSGSRPLDLERELRSPAEKIFQ